MRGILPREQFSGKASDTGGSEARMSRRDALERLRETLERITEMAADLEASASPAAAFPGIVT